MDKVWSAPHHGAGDSDAHPAQATPPAMRAHTKPAAALHGHALGPLVAQVYGSAPLAVKRSMLEHLMRPLGVLSLLAIGSGVFAKIRVRSGRPDAPIAVEQVRCVGVADIVALVDYVQQHCASTLAELPPIIDAVPVMSRTAALVTLMRVLPAKPRRRPGDART